MTSARMARQTYDWEERYRNDPRVKLMQEAMNRILANSFPRVAERLHKPEAPVVRSDSTVAPVLRPDIVVKPDKLAKPGDDREYVDPSAYMTESSASDADSQTEIDPSEALKEMERRIAMGQPPVDRPAKHEKQKRTKKQAVDEPMETGDDVDMDASASTNEDEDEEDDVDAECEVCHSSNDADRTLLCDGCDKGYHLYCLTPPLSEVPEGDWFCTHCVAARAQPRANEPEDMDLEDTPLSADAVRIKEEKRSRALGFEPVTPTSATTSIIQSFEQDAQGTNELLIHACHCDSVRCTDDKFSELCPSMRRFVRSAAWASRNEQWLTYRIAKITAELLNYHSLHCQATNCHVPLCDRLRDEEYV